MCVVVYVQGHQLKDRGCVFFFFYLSSCNIQADLERSREKNNECCEKSTVVAQSSPQSTVSKGSAAKLENKCVCVCVCVCLKGCYLIQSAVRM